MQSDTYAHTIRFSRKTGRAIKRTANARGHSISKVVNDLVTEVIRPKAQAKNARRSGIGRRGHRRARAQGEGEDLNMRLSVLYGAPQGRRSISQLLAEIAALADDEARVAALRAGPRALRELLHLTFGRHELDLPTGANIGIQPIPIDAYAENARGADHLADRMTKG
jgi:hypothetical protein